jgi:muramidase (phage lysozyme)
VTTRAVLGSVALAAGALAFYARRQTVPDQAEAWPVDQQPEADQVQPVAPTVPPTRWFGWGFDDQAQAAPTAEPEITPAPTFVDQLQAYNPVAMVTNAIDQRSVGDATMDTNARAFLALIAWAEGTDRAADPYRVCYAYRHTIQDFREHPKVSGEWAGEKLSDAMCRGAGLKPGCISTAAGRYQIIAPTWRTVRDRMGLPDFSPASQDKAALYLIRKRGALDAVQRGDVEEAVRLCRQEWASLPGNTAGQPQRRFGDLLAVYERAGGTVA